ncbi:MAG: hypothetical protein ACLFPS_08570 [Clostridia bacterium]
MNRQLYKFGLYGYILTLFGVLGFFGMSYRGFSLFNFVFLAPLLVGIFLLVYKNNGLYHYSKNMIIMFDFLYVIGLIFVAAIRLPKGLSLVLAGVLGLVASYTLIKFTFMSHHQ